MARKVVNRQAKAAEADAAEKAGSRGQTQESLKSQKTKKAAAMFGLRLYWGVI